MTPEEVRLLYEYNSWANHRTQEACATLTPEQFTRDMGSSFRSVRDTLTHILGGEWVWLERFQGRAPSAMPDTTKCTDLANLVARWGEIEADLLGYTRGLTQADLDRVMEYRTFGNDLRRNPLWQSLQHLVNHGTHHRGQVTTLLRQLGAQPKYLDLIHFYRDRSTATGA